MNKYNFKISAISALIALVLSGLIGVAPTLAQTASTPTCPGTDVTPPSSVPGINISSASVPSGCPVTVAWDGGSSSYECHVFLSDATRTEYNVWDGVQSTGSDEDSVTSDTTFTLRCLDASGGYIAGTPISAMVSASAAASVTKASKAADIIARSDSQITARITDLNALSARIQQMVNVSATVKSTLTNQIQTNVTGLTNLRSQIDGNTGTSTAALLAEEQTIFTSFRIYLLVIPRGYVLAAADRINVIGGIYATLSGQFQTLITQEQTSGKNVKALQAALTDMNTQVGNAQTLASQANALVLNLVPDQGDTTVQASNTAAIQTAKADILTAKQDLITAQQDSATIAGGL